MIKILVVDDEEGVRISLKKVLQRDGYDIMLAENGMEAVNIVRNHINEIETVICDFKMPGLDGLETLTEINKLNPEIIKIILTGYATLDRAIESVNSGIDGFLTKPFDNKELRLKIREFHVKKRLKQFVPSQVLNELQKFSQNLEPRNQKVTILFTDIRGFTKISETLTPSALSELLNLHYFFPLDNIIFKFNGTLDKHIGDSIMGIFGAPITQDDDAKRAVACAVEMRNKVQEINREMGMKNIKIPVGFGISTGDSMVGIFGSAIRKEYTALGKPVNLAARLERIALEDQILICSKTYEAVKDYFKVEKIDNINLKGIEGERSIYNVTGDR
ncbi:MAG: adenylate/guanylate cyclase domain-containing response regulator [Syntrophaceae bacterium]|nr:adenylate/guanylate cyclase domain-containing response regulator [Syntrophaceae bacterium]